MAGAEIKLGVRRDRRRAHPRLQLAGRGGGEGQGSEAGRPGARARRRPAPSNIQQDREILHVLPQEYIIDEQDGIKEPCWA